MPRPFLDPRRQELADNAVAGIRDELTQLSEMGVEALVCLIEEPADAGIYREAGFEVLCLPMANGSPPTRDQWLEFCRFVEHQLAGGRAVVAFCEAGLGRTGTMLAAYLVHGGESANAAIARVRGIEPAAIETSHQIAFLHEIEGFSRSGAGIQGSMANIPPPSPLGGAA
jgi:atypical dual specificity phosphatase